MSGTELSKATVGTVNGPSVLTERPGSGTTVLDREDLLQGRLTMKGDGHLLGRFQGEVDCAGELLVGKDAEVAANISGTNVTIAGLVRGNVFVTGRLKLTSTGRLEGDARVGSLIVYEGGVHRGLIEVHPEGFPAGGEEPKLLAPSALISQPASGEAAASAHPEASPTAAAIDRVKKLWGEFF